MNVEANDRRRKNLLTMIAAASAATGMSQWYIARAINTDPRFLYDLQKGRCPRIDTYRKAVRRLQIIVLRREPVAITRADAERTRYYA